MAGLAIQASFRPGAGGGSFAALQRRGPGAPSVAVDAARLGLLPGQGHGLPETLRGQMEALLAADLSSVRIHVGPQAGRIGALAFTAGHDIYFAPGQYRPETPDGRQLLGHELAHVLQQRQGRVRSAQSSGVTIVQDQAMEAEAERVGQRARHLSLAPPATKRPSAPVLPTRSAVQRAPASAALPPAHGAPVAGTGLRLPLGALGAIEIRFRAAEPPPAPSRGGTVQRKVGFELEDAFWEPYIKSPLMPLRAARRKEVLYSHALFKLEGDDTGGPNNPSIEFVTKPFAISNAGLNELETAFRAINVIMNRIGQNQNHNGGPANGDLNNPAKANFVTNDQHHLNWRLWLSKGRNQARFKVQATQGMSLEDLPVYMEYAGTNVPGENAQQTLDRQGLRTALYGGGLQGLNARISEVIGSAPTLADTAIQYLANNVGAPFNAGTERLRGFLSLVMLYVKMLSVPESHYLKYLIPLLPRTNLAAQLQQVPQAQRTALAANNAQPLINCVVHAANSVALIPNPNGGHYDANYTRNSPLVRAFTPVGGGGAPLFQSLTIKAWLRGLVAGTDYLTPSKMRAWLRDNDQLGRAARKAQSAYLESFGSLGRHTDAPLVQGRSRQVVFENRTIVGGHGGAYFTVQQAYEFAYRYLQFLINIRHTGGQPGAYPVNQPPPL